MRIEKEWDGIWIRERTRLACWRSRPRDRELSRRSFWRGRQNQHARRVRSPDTDMNAQQVADIFVEQRVLQPSQADEVLEETRLNGKTIEQALVDSGFVDQRAFY